MHSATRAFFWRLFNHIRRQSDDTLALELEFHLEMETNENLRRGLSPKEARRRALLALGGVDQTREAHRETGLVRCFDSACREFRIASRSLFRNRSFCAAAAITLALCIAANTVIFSIVYPLIIKPLPFQDSERLVEIYNSALKLDSATMRSNDAQFFDFKEHSSAFDQLALWQAAASFLEIGNESMPARGIIATAEFFDAMKVKPLIGSFFSMENCQPANNGVIVLTQSFWQSRFAGDPSVIGQTVRMEGTRYRIIGVAPRQIETLDARIKFLIPLIPSQTTARYWFSRTLYGRLKPGVSIGTALGQVKALEQKYYESAPGFMKEARDRAGLAACIDPVQSRRAEPLKLRLYLLQGASLIVVLIGSINVANLLLARFIALRGELAIRTALGAGRSMLVRHVFGESILLTGIGVVLGLAISWGALRIVNSYSAKLLPAAFPFAIDGCVLGYTALTAGFITCLLGLLPTIYVCCQKFAPIEQPIRNALTARSSRASGALIVFQLAAALLLLAGAGLLIRSFAKAISINFGFNPEQVITANFAAPQQLKSIEEYCQFQQRLVGGLKEIDVFGSVSIASATPLLRPPEVRAVWVRNREEEIGAMLQPMTLVTAASSDYLKTMQIPIIEGRWFSNDDAHNSRLVVVVDRDFAKQNFAGSSALGRQVSFYPGSKNQDWREIVGIVGNLRDPNLDQLLPAPHAQIYAPLAQHPAANLSLFIKRRGSAPESTRLLEKKLKELDPEITQFQVTTMDDVVREAFDERRAVLLLLGCFSGIALLLAAVGIYGVLAYYVSQRVREIGIRASIGASSKQIAIMILRQGLWKAIAGLAFGILCAFQLSHFMKSLLYEIEPNDPLTLFAVSVLLLIVAALASYLPARGAARIDPSRVLRTE